MRFDVALCLQLARAHGGGIGERRVECHRVRRRHDVEHVPRHHGAELFGRPLSARLHNLRVRFAAVPVMPLFAARRMPQNCSGSGR